MSVKFQDSLNQAVFDSGECYRSLNLLAHAQMIELDIGSQCGGHGKCGADRVMVSNDDKRKVNSPTEIEKIHLSNDQIHAGLRLACQCFPNEDGMDLMVKFNY